MGPILVTDAIALDISETLARISHGALRIIGSFSLNEADYTKFDLPRSARALALIGPNNPDFWPLFQKSDEYRDGKRDPLDRWSRRVLDQVAQILDAHACYPFGGPPYLPFYSWALRTGQVYDAPIRFLLSQEEGLWFSVRGALLLPTEIAMGTAAPNPCLSCQDRPCETACPVQALTISGYDVPKCRAFLRDRSENLCQTQGCLVRQACPLSKNAGRCNAQSVFHLQAFIEQ